MDKKKVRKWVKALESGKYKQAREVLYDGEGYCCLGVACSALAGVHSPAGCSIVDNAPFFATGSDLFDDIFDCGFGPASKKEQRLMNLNDAGKKPFSYIARWIRKNILGEDVIIDVDAYNRRRKNKKGTK